MCGVNTCNIELYLSAELVSFKTSMTLPMICDIELT